jgi:hypothetical protein
VTDLTEVEQGRVRIALRYLRTRAGGWKVLAPAIGYRRRTLLNVNEGRAVSPQLAFRVARLAAVTTACSRENSRRPERVRTADQQRMAEAC